MRRANHVPQISSTMWMVRSKRGKLFRTFLEKNIAALGEMEPDTTDIGDIGRYDTRELLKERVQEWRPDKLPGAVTYTVNILLQFSRGIQIGDYVITANPVARDFHYAVGVVIGEYRYEEAWDSETGRYPHARDVQWSESRVARRDLPPEIQAKLGQNWSVFKLSRTAMEKIIEVAAASAGRKGYNKSARKQ